MKRELLTYLSKFYSYIDFNFILVNPFNIGSFFSYKDRLPVSMLSSVVYEFSCTQGCVPPSYVGSTGRHLSDRICEHAGKSIRTGKLLSSPSHSNIRIHSLNCSCSVDIDHFSVLSSTSDEIDLRILESLYIFKKRPSLNEMQSSFPLSIV